MSKHLALFPLNMVVYPGEELNLHIFEPRYRQLVDECLEADKPFGIPAFINDAMPGYGTEVQILTMHKRYDDGRMDIKTSGVSVFSLDTFENPIPGKLYAGGQVRAVESGNSEAPMLKTLLDRLKKLYDLLQIETDFDAALPSLSYRIAHKVGLSIEQEYEMLTIADEADRQQFLIKHLDNVIPVVSDMERTKQRIRMNGHFKNLDPLNF